MTEHIGTWSSQFHLYIAKEDLDNAADYVENTYMDASNIRAISVFVQTSDTDLIFTVRNSNPNNESTAFQTNLHDIVNYEYFTSTKKNKFRIGRGAIGDATKPILSIPYAMLYEKGHIFNGMAAPLTITYNNQQSKISLDTSKFITNKLEAIIKTEPRPLNQTSYTEVRISVPRDKLSYDLVNEFKEYCLNYSIFSTHIRFYFGFNDEKITTPNDAIASNTWTNEITAWAYTDNEFLIFIENLVDQSISVSTALTGFRELKWLPKEWAQKKLNELSMKEKTGLLTELKDHSTPMNDLSIPYGGNKECNELRKDALFKRIAAVYPVKPKHRAEYKIVRTRYVLDDGKVNFPYVFEVIAVPFSDIWNSYPTFIGAVNNSVSIVNRGKSLYDGNYIFKKKGKTCQAWNIEGILDHWYGYRVRESSKSHPCVIAVNLLTPKVQWKDQGKSTLVIDPFANTIAETISRVMEKIPTFHGYGVGKGSKSEPHEERKIAIDYLRDFLRDRCEKVEADPSLKTRDRLTQSGVFYRVRRIMIEDGFEPPKDWGTTRSTLQNGIMKTCQELWPDESITREQLGIVASARATMLYNGQSYPVDIDSVKQLADKGIAILVIEKEGIADVLAPYAEEYHIALVHTQGRLTEYGKDLIEEIKEIGSIVWTLTDYDATGIDISNKTRTPTPRIGITRETVKWLQENGYDIEEEDVEEEYPPPKGTPITDEYLGHHRIELDSIVERVGGEGLWEYIIDQAQLPEFSPNGFNLGKVIELPDDDRFYPEIADRFRIRFDAWKNKQLEVVDNYLRNLLESRKQEIEDELESHELVKIKDKENEIEEDLKTVVENDKGSDKRQKIETKFEKLIENLDKLDTLLGVDSNYNDDDESNNGENRHVD
ncbi:MAG: hypothetical protein ACRD8W_01980 [Nitrososphaeraceae archaeon]